MNMIWIQVWIFSLSLLSYQIFSYVYCMKGSLNFFPTSFYKCYYNSGYDSIGVIAQISHEGQLDLFNQDLVNAISAGLQAQAIYIACRGLSVQYQINLLKKIFNPNNDLIFWIYPAWEDQNSQCSWFDKNTEANCKYLQSLLQQMQKNNLRTGIITDTVGWTTNFGQREACPIIAQQVPNLWWVPDDSQVGPDFTNYKKIGGWKQPIMKTYLQTLYAENDLLGTAVKNDLFLK